MVAYGGDLYLFGGFWHNISYGTYVNCGTEPCTWFNDMWVYSSLGNKWTQLYPGGTLPAPRYGHTATVVGENMYVFGGNANNTLKNDMWAYSFAFNVWQKLAPVGAMPSPRYAASAVAIGEAVWIYGGTQDGSTVDVDLFGFFPHIREDTTTSSTSDDEAGLVTAEVLNIVLTFLIGVIVYLNYKMLTGHGYTHLDAAGKSSYT